MIPRGNRGRGRKQYQCKECGKYFTPGAESSTEKISETKNTREISKTVPERIVNEEQLISQCEIDTQVWEVERWTCDKKEMLARGDRHTLFQVKVWLKKKVEESASRDVINAMVEDAKRFAPKYPKIVYPKGERNSLLYEIDMADLHFGKLTWAQETGSDYDIQIAAESARHAFSELLLFVKNMPVGKILLPLGNDFFNVNGLLGIDGKTDMEFEDWIRCVKGDDQALHKMLDYNKDDVVIMEELYLKLRPWIPGHPNLGVYADVENSAIVLAVFLGKNDRASVTVATLDKF